MTMPSKTSTRQGCPDRHRGQVVARRPRIAVRGVHLHRPPWRDVAGGREHPRIPERTMEQPAPKRKRKLLLHRLQITKLARGIEAKGYTIVPLSLYFKDGRVKAEIALARGKKEFDKRQALREEQDKREAPTRHALTPTCATSPAPWLPSGGSKSRMSTLWAISPTINASVALHSYALEPSGKHTRPADYPERGNPMSLSKGIQSAAAAALSAAMLIAVAACGTTDGTDTASKSGDSSKDSSSTSIQASTPAASRRTTRSPHCCPIPWPATAR